MPLFDAEKSKIKYKLDLDFVDIIPVEILNELFILPEICLDDDNYKDIFFNFKNYTIRDIKENEFKTVKIL